MAVIGASADDIRAQYGDWTYFTHPKLIPNRPAVRPYVTIREGIEVIGASSDHTILDVEAVKDKVHVGDVLEFGIKAYGPMAYLTSSDGVHMVFKGGKQNA